MNKKKIVIIILLIIFLDAILWISKVIPMVIGREENSKEYSIQELVDYGEYLESLDLAPNAIVARIDGDEILFHEVTWYRNQINYSIENNENSSLKEDSPFYRILKDRMFIKLAKDYPDYTTYQVDVADEKERMKTEWENYTESEREHYLSIIGIKEDEIWLSPEDFLTYLQKSDVDMKWNSKGIDVLFKIMLEKPEIVNDKKLEKKVRKYKQLQENIANNVEEIRESQEDTSKYFSEAYQMLIEIQETFINDLILNCDIELCVDKGELSYRVPEIYGDTEKDTTKKVEEIDFEEEDEYPVSKAEAIEIFKTYQKEVLKFDREYYPVVQDVEVRSVHPDNYFEVQRASDIVVEEATKEAWYIRMSDGGDLEYIIGYVDLYTGEVIGGRYGGV
ncbi:MAG: hypothetical protein IJ867_01035 [Clostridia bacterium]|nr:hypothetical protein [Clostridia bacterium]